MAARTRDHQYYAYLAQRVRLGDEAAFAELYEQTFGLLHRYALYFLRDRELAMDALQEIYIAVYKNIGSLKLDRLLLPWMKQIAYHVCCDMAGDARRRQALPLPGEEDSGEPGYLPEDASLSEDECFRAVFDRDLSRRLYRALDELPQKESMAFRLRYERGLKLEEVADFMGVSLASAKRYIASARQALQKSLDDLKAHA